MSISRDEFEKGKKKDSLKEQIMDFLKENKDEAFTATEIAKSIGIVDWVRDVNEDLTINMKTFIKFLHESLPGGVWFNFYRALNELVRENKIKNKKIGSEDYYSI